jgi:hypothetical protein
VSDRFEAETVTFFEKVRAGYGDRGEPAREGHRWAAPLRSSSTRWWCSALLSISRALA